MTHKLANKWDDIKTATGKLLLDPLREAKSNFNQIKKKDRKMAYLLVGALIVILIITIFASYTFFGKTHSYNIEEVDNFHSSSLARGQVNPTEATEDVTVTNFLKSYKWALDFFTPIFDSFISSTADVTGKSTPSGNGYSFNMFASNPTEFITGTTIQPATVYYSKSLVIVVPIAVLLIVIKGFNIVVNPNGRQEPLKDFFIRVVTTIALLILTPTIMSLSIIFANLLSKSFLGDGAITDFMITFIEGLETEYSAGTADYIVSAFSNVTSLGILGFINSLPIVLPLTLILLLFLYVSFQFIIRFLNLYFLAAIYPFAVVFNMHEKTANIHGSFWKQWIGFLIHQPVFVLGYSIVQGLLTDMLESGGVGLEQILIFLGFLLFLASVNMIASRIWGDVYTAISQNISAGMATAFTAKAVKTPANKVNQKVQSFKSGAFGGITTGASSYAGKKIGEKVGLIGNGRTSGFNKTKGTNKSSLSRGSDDGVVNHTKLNDGAKSYLANELTEKGIDVSSRDPENGIISVNGDFYGHKSQESGLTTLYTSQEEAIKDGIPKEEVKEISVKGLNIRDTSNRAGTQRYNRTIGKFKKEKGFPGKVHLTQSASDGWVKNNMKLGKGFNQTRNIAGVAVKRYAKKAEKDDPKGRIPKIHVYNEMLEK